MDKKTGVDTGLTDNVKTELHKLAQSAIANRLKGKNTLPAVPDSKILNENRGAFVSLHYEGNLRGCIGYIHAVKPLYKTIHEMAISAAFQDPRFKPLTETELNGLDIEISVLTPMQIITDTDEIIVGVHGLMIVKDGFSGLLLPQVATEYGWDRQSFLEHTCSKAGLPTDAWKDNETKIYSFSAEVF